MIAKFKLVHFGKDDQRYGWSQDQGLWARISSIIKESLWITDDASDRISKARLNPTTNHKIVITAMDIKLCAMVEITFSSEPYLHKKGKTWCHK